MLRCDGLLDGLLLQVQGIQRGQLGLQPCQRFQHRTVSVFDIGQPRVTLFLDLADQLRLVLGHQTLGSGQVPEGTPRHQDAHEVRRAQQVLRVALLAAKFRVVGVATQDVGGLVVVAFQLALGHPARGADDDGRFEGAKEFFEVH